MEGLLFLADGINLEDTQTQGGIPALDARCGECRSVGLLATVLMEGENVLTMEK